MKSNARKVCILFLLAFTIILTGFANEVPPQQQRVAVLTFHSVSNEFEMNPTVITQSELEKTFKLMQENGYNAISLQQFHNFIDGRGTVPDKAVLITFDDGYENNFTLGYPVARKYKVPAVIFAVTKWFSAYPRPEPHVPHLTEAQARTMLAEGLWTIASHSFDGHRKVPGATGPGAFYTTKIQQTGYNETDEAYKARLVGDIALSTFTLDKLGADPVDFAFPYGAYNDEAKEILAKSGYRYFFTSQKGLNKQGQDPHQIYRIPAGKLAIQNLAVLDYYFANDR